MITEEGSIQKAKLDLLFAATIHTINTTYFVRLDKIVGLDFNRLFFFVVRFKKPPLDFARGGFLVPQSSVLNPRLQ